MIFRSPAAPDWARRSKNVCVGYNQVTRLRSSRTRSPRQGGAGCVLTSHSNNNNCNDNKWINNDNSNINGVRQWGVQNSSVGQTREHQSCLSSQLRHSRHQKEGRNKERQKNKTKKEKKGEKEVSNSIYTNSRSTAPRLLLVLIPTAYYHYYLSLLLLPVTPAERSIGNLYV